MLLSDRTKKINRVIYGAVFLAASVIISIVESLSHINALIPFPGVKLGLCNVAITACLYVCGGKTALCVALLRPLFMFLFVSNPVSLVMSLSGGMLSFLSVVLTKKLYTRVFSFCGISCISGVCHALGQTLGAAAIMGDSALFGYLPIFAACSSVTGTICGGIMNIVIPRISKIGIKAGVRNA